LTLKRLLQSYNILMKKWHSYVLLLLALVGTKMM